MSTVVYDRETLARNPRHFANAESFGRNGVHDGPLRAGDRRHAVVRRADLGCGDGRLPLRAGDSTRFPPWPSPPMRGGICPVDAERHHALEQDAWPGGCSPMPKARVWPISKACLHSRPTTRWPSVCGANWKPGSATFIDFHEIKLGEVDRDRRTGTADAGPRQPNYYPGGYSTPASVRDERQSDFRPTQSPDRVSHSGQRQKDIAPLTLNYPKIPVATVDKPLAVQFTSRGDRGQANLRACPAIRRAIDRCGEAR